MAFCRLVFTVLLISVSCYGNHVPVYMWGEQIPLKGNPLDTVSEDTFYTFLDKELAHKPQLVVFVEETLSTEDLSSKASGPIYAFLQKNVASSAYLPSVDNPLPVLKKLASPAQQVDVTEDGFSEEVQDDGNVFIYFKDVKEDESRTEMLQRHDAIMAEVYGKLKKAGKEVVGVYTGRFPSWVVTESHSRKRRQAETATESEDYVLDSLRLYVERLDLVQGDQTTTLSGVPTSTSVVNTTEKIMNTTITMGDQTFVMNFRIEMGYWFLDSITLKTTPEEHLYPAEDLYAITGFSYRCGQKTTFANTNETAAALVFYNLQVQPFFAPINGSVPFGDAFDCVGFFSGPIWAGLLVTFIVLLITFYGIMMMMDIRTMDRFDDPKGKTITISAAE